MDDIALVGQARPLVQVVLVVYVTDQGLALLGQHHPQHVHWAAELGLPLLKVLLVLPVTLDFGHVHGPHHLGVILNVSGSNVVAKLLAKTFLVLVLKKGKKKKTCLRLLKINLHYYLCGELQSTLTPNIFIRLDSHRFKWVFFFDRKN